MYKTGIYSHNESYMMDWLLFENIILNIYKHLENRSEQFWLMIVV